MKAIDYLNGLELVVHEGDQQGVLFTQNVYNYERHIFDWLQRRPQPNVFLDVGANYGHYLMVAKHLWGIGQPVWMVEPNQRLQDAIITTVKRNKMPNVRLLPFAASDRWEMVYCNATKNTWDNGNVFCVSSEEPSYNYSQAQAVPLDDVVPALRSNDIVKLDVEGFEYKALRGMQKLLVEGPTVVFEFCPEVCCRSGVTAEGLLDFVFSMGYVIEVLPYHKGMEGTFTEVEPLMRYVKETSVWICDLVAKVE